MAWTEIPEDRDDTDTVANHSADHNQMAGLANDLAAANPLLTRKASADDPPDDEFNDATGMSGATNGLDAKWTAVSGTSGTVDMFGTGDVSKYDLASRPGWLLMQAGSNGSQKVSIREDWTIGTDECIVVAFAMGLTVDGATGFADNQHDFIVSLNTSDTDYNSGSYAYLSAQTYNGGTRFSAYNGSTEYTTTAYTHNAWSGPQGHLAFIRFDYDGTLVWPSFTFGGGWVMMGPGYSLTPTNLWVVSNNAAAHGDPAPIDAVYYVRQGDNSLIPW